MFGFESFFSFLSFFKLVGLSAYGCIFLLILCFLKPFFGRGWLISAAFFFLLSAVSSNLRQFYGSDFYNFIPFHLHNFYYFIWDPMINGLSIFSILMFLYMIFMKKEYGVKNNAILFSCDGRFSRSQYWFLRLIIAVLYIYIIYVFAVYKGDFSIFYDSRIDLFSYGVVGVIALIGLWFAIAVEIKRWHDCNKSAWYCLLNFIPVVGFLVSVFYLGIKKGDSGINEYGDEPVRISDKAN